MNRATFAYATSALLSIAAIMGGCTNPHAVVVENEQDSGTRPEGDGGGLTNDGGGTSDGSLVRECLPNGVTFGLTVDSTDPVCYAGPRPPWPEAASLGCAGWLTITGPGGQPLNLSKGGCEVPCVASKPESATSQSLTWDGTLYPVTATGNPNTDCSTPACAPAGVYVATMCAGYAGPDAGPVFCNGAPTCKQVSFTWPPSSPNQTIDLTITPTPSGG